MLTSDLQVNNNNDDAHEDGLGAFFENDSTVYTSSFTVAASANYRAGGVVIDGVTISQGSKIVVAYLTPYVLAAFDDANFLIYCNAVDNADDFGTTADILGRARTTASADWDADGVTGGGDAFVNSPSVVGPVQEQINRPGWSSGNSLCFLWIPKLEAFKSFRPRTHDNNPALACKLHLEWIPKPRPIGGIGTFQMYCRGFFEPWLKKWQTGYTGLGGILVPNTAEIKKYSTRV